MAHSRSPGSPPARLAEAVKSFTHAHPGSVPAWQQEDGPAVVIRFISGPGSNGLRAEEVAGRPFGRQAHGGPQAEAEVAGAFM